MLLESIMSIKDEMKQRDKGNKDWNGSVVSILKSLFRQVVNQRDLNLRINLLSILLMKF